MLLLALLALLASAIGLQVGPAQSAHRAPASVADGPPLCSQPHCDVADTATPSFEGHNESYDAEYIYAEDCTEGCTAQTHNELFSKALKPTHGGVVAKVLGPAEEPALASTNSEGSEAAETRTTESEIKVPNFNSSQNCVGLGLGTDLSDLFTLAGVGLLAPSFEAQATTSTGHQLRFGPLVSGGDPGSGVAVWTTTTRSAWTTKTASPVDDRRMLLERSMLDVGGRGALLHGAVQKAKAMLGGGRSNIWTNQPQNTHTGCGGALQRSRPVGGRRRRGR